MIRNGICIENGVLPSKSKLDNANSHKKDDEELINFGLVKSSSNGNCSHNDAIDSNDIAIDIKPNLFDDLSTKNFTSNISLTVDEKNVKNSKNNNGNKEVVFQADECDNINKLSNNVTTKKICFKKMVHHDKDFKDSAVTYTIPNHTCSFKNNRIIFIFGSIGIQEESVRAFCLKGHNGFALVWTTKPTDGALVKENFCFCCKICNYKLNNMKGTTKGLEGYIYENKMIKICAAIYTRDPKKEITRPIKYMISTSLQANFKIMDIIRNPQDVIDRYAEEQALEMLGSVSISTRHVDKEKSAIVIAREDQLEEKEDEMDKVAANGFESSSLPKNMASEKRCSGGILKKTRSISDSMDSDKHHHFDSESCGDDDHFHNGRVQKKSVSFSDEVSKKLYSSHLSIVQQEKRRQRRCKQKERRSSESDMSESEDYQFSSYSWPPPLEYSSGDSATTTDISSSEETDDSLPTTHILMPGRMPRSMPINAPSNKKGHKKRGKKSARKNASSAKYLHCYDSS